MSDTLMETLERTLRVVTLVFGAVSAFIGGIMYGLRIRRAAAKKEEAEGETAAVVTDKTRAEVRQVDVNIQKIQTDITTQLSDKLLALVNELQEELKDVKVTLSEERVQRISERTELQKDLDQLRVRISASEYKNDKFQRGIRILIGQLHDNGLIPAWTPFDEETTK